MSRSYAAVRELSPTSEQVQILLRHVGSVRFAQNWALAFVKQKISDKESQSWSAISLHTEWRKHRQDVAPWYSEVSKETFQYGCERLATGLKNWSESKKGKRKGPKVKFPKKRKRGRNDSVCYTSATIKSSTSVYIPRIGEVTLKEAFNVPENTRVTGIFIRPKAGRWFVTFRLKEDNWKEPAKKEIISVTGVDAGIGGTFATTSSGEKILNPRFYRKSEKKLKYLSKALKRKNKGSRNKRKAYNKIAVHHYRTANKRKDFTHKFTTNLVKTHDEIVVEDLNLRGMSKRKGFKLGKSVSDVAWGEVRRQLEYKTSWYGKTLTIVSRWFPSSKMCSNCKYVNKDLDLSERTWVCPRCDIALDRDLNAAQNLRDESSVAASSVVIVCGDGVGRGLALAAVSEAENSSGDTGTLLTNVNK